MILKYLVDHLLENKLHKSELFLRDGKAQEKKSLLRSIKQGDFPAKISAYSSRTVSSVVRQLLQDSYAPLLPYERFSDLETFGDLSTNVHREEIICGIIDTLIPERRGLLESILLLLYKLALKGGPQSNSQLLGEVVGALLARPSEHELAETMLLRRVIGVFLIENAPAVLCRKEDESDNERQEQEALDCISDDHAYVERGSTLRKRSSVSDITTRNTAVERTDPPKQSAPLSPTQKISRAGSVMLITAKETFQRMSPTNLRLRAPSIAVSEAATAPSCIAKRKSLSSADSLMAKHLLTAIVESPQDKRGLFVEQPGRDDEVNALDQLVSSSIGKELKYLPLGSFSVLALASCAKQLLKLHVEPLLGFDSVELMLRSPASGSHEHDAELSQMAETVLGRLDGPRNELLSLIVRCACAAVDAGTDRGEIGDALMDFLVARDASQGASSTISCISFCFYGHHFAQLIQRSLR